MSEPTQSYTSEAIDDAARQLRLEIESLEERLRVVEKSVQDLRAQFERALALARQSQPSLNEAKPVERISPDLPGPLPERVPVPAPAAMLASAPSSSLPGEAVSTKEEAKRYARLLVSEIELYNPVEVAEGLEKKDLYTRLKVHIDRSRRAYEQRFGKATTGRLDYFHEEMVRVLAQGDAALLGPEYPFH